MPISNLDPRLWLEKLAQNSPEAAMGRARSAQDAILGTLDSTLAMGSGLASAAVAGAVAAPHILIPGSDSGQVFQDTLARIPTYQPQTEYGQAQVEGLAAPGGIGEKIDAPFRWVGEKAQEGAQALGASPELAGLAGSAGYTLANLVGPVEVAQGARALPGIVANAAEDTVMAGAGSNIWAGRVTQAKRNHARRLKDSGADELEIFLATGVFEAPDGTLREWIPDADFQLNEVHGRTRKDTQRNELFTNTTAGERFAHPELFDRYPELADLKVAYREGIDEKGGGLATDTRDGRAVPSQLQIGTGREHWLHRGDGTIPSDSLIVQEEPQTALHELQHAVDVLDFGVGGTNPAAIPIPQELQLQLHALQEAASREMLKGNPEAALAHRERAFEILQAIDREKFQKYRANSGEALSRSVERVYESGARTPEELVKAFPSGPMGALDVDPASLWFDKPTQEPQFYGKTDTDPLGRTPAGEAAAQDGPAFEDHMRLVETVLGRPARQADALEDPTSARLQGDAPQKLAPQDFRESTPAEFDSALAAARDAMAAGGDNRSALQVDAKLPDDFQGRVFVSPDGLSGFAVSDTGYVSNLFKHPSATYKDVMGAVLSRARAEGGKTLDAFDTGLAEGYKKRGAVETGRSPWNDEYSPQGWDTNTMGRPDYVSMNIGRNPLKIELPEEKLAVSSIPTLYDNNVPALKRGTHNVVSLAKQFSKAARQVWGRRDMTEFTQRNVDDVSQVIAAETEAAMQKNGHAGTWYSDTLDDAHAVADEIYGAGTMAEPTRKTAFNFALAITSNGQLVKGNSALAHKAFSEYLKTGRFPVIGQGKEAGSMKIGFSTYNKLADTFGEEAVQKFLNTEYTVGELKAAGFNIADESVDLKVPGAAIFGPKIGGGFFANLQGDFSRLTADRWLTRTMSRIIGDIYDSNPAKLKKQLGEFRSALEAAGQPAPKSDAALKKLAVKMHKAFAKGDSSGSYPKSMRNPANNAARNVAKSLSPAKESPRNGTERNYYRAIAQRAVEKLREKGIETTVSDLQALIWYPEQDLYRKMGYSAKPDVERDYLEAFKSLAKEAGVSQEKIDAALRGARDRRLSAHGDDRGADSASVRAPHRRAFEGRQDKGRFLEGLAPLAPQTKGLLPLEKRVAKVRSLFSD